MKKTIYLRVDRHNVLGMSKTMPSIYKDEIVVKLNLEVKDKVFGSPVIEQNVTVVDWASNIDIQDVEFSKSIITEQEAQMIRERRLQRMKEILESQGFTVVEKSGDEE